MDMHNSFYISHIKLVVMLPTSHLTNVTVPTNSLLQLPYYGGPFSNDDPGHRSNSTQITKTYKLI